MDEHDKRAREVMAEVFGGSASYGAQLFVIASALRSTAAAAVAAERERCARFLETEYADSLDACRMYAGIFASRLRASAAPAAAAASPAQAEWVSEEDVPLELPPLPYRRAVPVGRVTLPPTIDIDDGEPDPATAERQRIVARLRASADRLEDLNRGGYLGGVRPERSYASTVLRSEADALEGT